MGVKTHNPHTMYNRLFRWKQYSGDTNTSSYRIRTEKIKERESEQPSKNTIINIYRYQHTYVQHYLCMWLTLILCWLELSTFNLFNFFNLNSRLVAVYGRPEQHTTGTGSCIRQTTNNALHSRAEILCRDMYTHNSTTQLIYSHTGIRGLEHGLRAACSVGNQGNYDCERASAIVLFFAHPRAQHEQHIMNMDSQKNIKKLKHY